MPSCHTVVSESRDNEHEWHIAKRECATRRALCTCKLTVLMEGLKTGFKWKIDVENDTNFCVVR